MKKPLFLDDFPRSYTLIDMSKDQRRIITNWIVAPSLMIVVCLIVVFVAGPISYVTEAGQWSFLTSIALYSNAFFASFGVLVLCPLLWVIGRTGVFDVLSYSFYRLFESYKRGGAKKYDTAYDYKVAKQEKREKNKLYLLPFWTFGAVSFLIALILNLIVVL